MGLRDRMDGVPHPPHQGEFPHTFQSRLPGFPYFAPTSLSRIKQLLLVLYWSQIDS